MDCIFCKIVNGEINSYKIYDDELVIAFLDINPMTTGHTLIVPKKHNKDIEDIDEKTLIHIMNIAKKIKSKMEEKLNIDGITLIQNNGDVQDVKHFHLHLKPYYKENLELDIKKVYDLLS
ncbi:MAG: HIT domain-containing protein [Firmicutes bacterium]|nr:HIT domain-containing protein [Bacillota bacterium]